MSERADTRLGEQMQQSAAPNMEGATPADWVLFAGSAHPKLGEAVARTLGVSLGACSIERFPDGETSVRIEQSVRGRIVLVVQPTGPPVNDNLVEL
ncbi:MAG TPA: ribose-phosphate pyrophosphokinase-like domain-containing protein, partial [Longimicrobiales bacterium]|nr:ribose-phosphate pyrophosphokinase-like domain-containing protein [Longimicrobiales bacterium]